MDTFFESVSRLNPVSLDEIESLKLLNRIDRKYIIRKEQFYQLSGEIFSDYSVLSINNKIIQPYKTTYYDTPCLQLYLDHHNKRANRIKIRVRTYTSTGEKFLEVKRRVTNGETRKKRMLLADSSLNNETVENFIMMNSNMAIDQLKPSAQTNFDRITLTSEKNKERVTIDFDLKFIINDRSLTLQDYVILEVKRDKDSGNVGIATFLKEKQIYPISISKYCLAVASLNSEVKHNTFKPILRKLKIYNDGNNY